MADGNKCRARPCVPAKWRRVQGLEFVLRCQLCRRVMVTAKADTERLAREFERDPRRDGRKAAGAAVAAGAGRDKVESFGGEQ